MLSLSLLATMGFGQVFAAEGDEGGEGGSGSEVTEPITLTEENVSLSESSHVYNGKTSTPTVTVKDGDTELAEGTDYDVSGLPAGPDAKAYTITVTGKDKYAGEVSLTYTVTPRSIADATVSGVADKDYTGRAITQSPAVSVSGIGTLTNGKDYTISYKNNTSAGTATMTITGKGNYKDAKNVSFKIFGKADNKGWQKRNGVWYYFNNDGTKRTNAWAKDSHGWCWMGSNGKITTNKWIKYKGEWYYLKSNGYMAANEWAKDSKGWCWMNGSGKITRSRWIKTGGQWYYLKSNGYMAANAWAKDSHGWCWMGGNGKIVSSKWIKWKGDWYYLKSNGYMAANKWQKDSKGWCYLKSSGKMAKNEGVKTSGTWWLMDGSGHLVTSPYVIVVKSEQMLYYYTSNNKLSMKTSVVTGKWYPKDHDTPTGTYRLRAKQTDQTLRGLEDDGKTKYESHVSYWMPFIGNSYGLHDATWRGSFGGTIYKYSGSHGCVNMPYSKAKELYSKIKVNTIVRIQ